MTPTWWAALATVCLVIACGSPNDSRAQLISLGAGLALCLRFVLDDAAEE